MRDARLSRADTRALSPELSLSPDPRRQEWRLTLIPSFQCGNLLPRISDELDEGRDLASRFLLFICRHEIGGVLLVVRYRDERQINDCSTCGRLDEGYRCRW